MTRRSGKQRVTRHQEVTGTEIPGRTVSGLRQRNPVAYWVAIIGAAAMVISTFASALSAFL
jgi:hypothetical protein